jgi:hypothetical protein
MSSEHTTPSQPPLRPRTVLAPADERRANPRFVVDRDVEIRLLDDVLGRPLAAHMVDLSAGGIGLRMARPLARGREFMLILPGQAASATLAVINPASGGAALRYRVVSCRPERDGQFFIGCSFIRVSNTDGAHGAHGAAKRATGTDAGASGASAAA